MAKAHAAASSGLLGQRGACRLPQRAPPCLLTRASRPGSCLTSDQDAAPQTHERVGQPLLRHVSAGPYLVGKPPLQYGAAAPCPMGQRHRERLTQHCTQC